VLCALARTARHGFRVLEPVCAPTKAPRVLTSSPEASVASTDVPGHTLVAALLSPLDAGAAYLFTLHMLQHMLLMLVAAALFAL